MVIKTDTCYYSEYKIYPGRGIRTVRRDGKLLAFISSKVKSLYNQKIKAQKLTWSQQWRRRNKKGRVENVQKRAKKRAARVYKAIAGLAVEEIHKARSQTADVRRAKREATVRSVKDRQRKQKDASKKTKKAKKNLGVKASTGFNKVPKYRARFSANTGKR